jgi:methylphosphotriester-DNA--protein-cysteine methyltransferase
MRYYAIQPPGRLQEFVSHFWVSEFEASGTDVFTWLSTADSCAKIVFFYCNESLTSSSIQGHTQTHGCYPNKGSFGIFGVTLFSHAIPQLFGMPAPEISNQMLNLDILLGSKGAELNEKMAEAADTRQRVNTITAFLEDQLTRHYTPETVITRAIRLIRTQRTGVDLDALAGQCFLSSKQFERRFREWSGFMPKLYARIIRFETALGSYDGQRLLTGIAHECGYYDQSHFIRDFKEFAGLPPARYFSSQSAKVEI